MKTASFTVAVYQHTMRVIPLFRRAQFRSDYATEASRKKVEKTAHLCEIS